MLLGQPIRHQLTVIGSPRLTAPDATKEQTMKKIILAAAIALGTLVGATAASATHGDEFDHFFEWVADNR